MESQQEKTHHEIGHHSDSDEEEDGTLIGDLESDSENREHVKDVLQQSSQEKDVQEQASKLEKFIAFWIRSVVLLSVFAAGFESNEEPSTTRDRAMQLIISQTIFWILATFAHSYVVENKIKLPTIFHTILACIMVVFGSLDVMILSEKNVNFPYQLSLLVWTFSYIVWLLGWIIIKANSRSGETFREMKIREK